ncbi:MAG TPA: helix-turn-helix domain-containing protein [Pilimelia sp.]|nr:helix-turn-helix domain-containing protein [Pilimelia sp.]
MSDPWIAVHALGDPTRRALYDYVRRQAHQVSREEAAEQVGVSRNLAAFHLDKLVEAGLLRADYAPPPGRRGRGRTPKVYAAAADGLAVTIPERRYDLLAEILADAVAAGDDAGEAAHRLAHDRGRQLGTQRRGTALIDVLAGLGFEPAGAEGQPVRLRNCPFHALAARQPALICGLNLAFVTGVLAGLGGAERRADLAPAQGACCVAVTPTGPAGAPADPAGTPASAPVSPGRVQPVSPGRVQPAAG